MTQEFKRGDYIRNMVTRKLYRVEGETEKDYVLRQVSENLERQPKELVDPKHVLEVQAP